jgi:hypothetical protein
VYWTDWSVDQQLGSIMRAPLDGGPMQIVSSQPNYPAGLKTDRTHAYWIPLWLGQIQRVPLAGGAMEILASDQDYPNALAVDATHVYWALGPTGQIRRVALDGGTPVTIFSATTSHQLVVKNGFVYWIEDGATGSVRRGPVQGGAIQIVAANQDSPLFLDTDGVQVYWFSSWQAPQLFSAPLDGGPPVRLLTPLRMGGMAVGGTDLYFGGESLRRLSR